ncbi:MAG TPA: hypothetical protein P5545_04260, partial [Bacteroidota bacterium]|nr:hypothetical protein [Bacteroidota bacterium]
MDNKNPEIDKLFEDQQINQTSKINPPLAERMRPSSLDEVLGQEHLLGEYGPLRQFIEDKDLPSIVF